MRAHRFVVPLSLVAVVCLFTHRARADELVTGYVAAQGPQCFQTATNAKLAWQCPGQIDYYRPVVADAGADAGCAADGGFCDFKVDFITNPDPYQTQMAGSLSKICVANIDGGTTTCSFARVNP